MTRIAAIVPADRQKRADALAELQRAVPALRRRSIRDFDLNGRIVLTCVWYNSDRATLLGLDASAAVRLKGAAADAAIEHELMLRLARSGTTAYHPADWPSVNTLAEALTGFLALDEPGDAAALTPRPHMGEPPPTLVTEPRDHAWLRVALRKVTP